MIDYSIQKGNDQKMQNIVSKEIESRMTDWDEEDNKDSGYGIQRVDYARFDVIEYGKGIFMRRNQRAFSSI